MQIFTYFLIGMSIFAAAFMYVTQFGIAQPESVLQGHSEVQRYRFFTNAVQLYISANPSFTGTLDWAAIKASATTPVALSKLDMPAGFKAVVNAGQFTVCGELSSAAIAEIVGDLPDQVRGGMVQVASAPASPFHVIGAASASYVSEASKCIP